MTFKQSYTTTIDWASDGSDRTVYSIYHITPDDVRMVYTFGTQGECMDKMTELKKELEAQS